MTEFRLLHAVLEYRVGWGLKATDRARPLLIPYMYVEDWAILGLEASVTGALTSHPAVS